MSVAIGKSLETSSKARPTKWSRPVLPAFTPIGARHRSGSGNAITELGHGRECPAQQPIPLLPRQARWRQPNKLFKGTPDLSQRFGSAKRGAP
jgi:hypothetical protein